MQNLQKAVRPIPHFGLVPGQTLSCKTFQLSYTDEARWLLPPDPLLLAPTTSDLTGNRERRYS